MAARGARKKGQIEMDHRIASARPLGRALTASFAAAGLLAAAMLVATPALAQQPSPPAKPAAKPAEKKPAAAKPAAQQKTPQQAQPQPPQPQQQAGAETPPQLMYSPWLKVCGKGPETNNKQVCVITKDGRLENGMPVAIVQLFEPEGEAKVLRVTVPLGMQLQHGTRMVIDQDPPTQEPYKICFPVGCMSDYPVTDDTIAKLKKGQNIILQAINMQGTAISLPLPLADFAKAYDGPPTDPKVVEEQQHKLQEELQKRAEDARKKLEAQQPAGSAAAPAAAQKK
jgi:invasion protein IalB